jgi:hypothetical protein
MSTANGGRLSADLLYPSGTARREAGVRYDVAGAGVVSTSHVQLARGWRHEVNLEHDAVDEPIADEHGNITDPGGPVRRRDTLWLPDAVDAHRLARAAADALRQVAGDWPLNGLSQLARRLGITTAEHS